jgi:hypothetical protein
MKKCVASLSLCALMLFFAAAFSSATPARKQSSQPSATPSQSSSEAARKTPASNSQSNAASATSNNAANTGSNNAANAQAAPEKKSGMVWVNTETGVYHRPGTRWYGKTKKGKYMTEADAIKAGYKAAAKN